MDLRIIKTIIITCLAQVLTWAGAIYLGSFLGDFIALVMIVALYILQAVAALILMFRGRIGGSIVITQAVTLAAGALLSLFVCYTYGDRLSIGLVPTLASIYNSISMGVYLLLSTCLVIIRSKNSQ
ncbi:MAG: hypothetical protein IJJ03_10305 [Mogibacterium sp.]|nr:hypothetical protein [Mogibacterium sp.]MBQ6502154.1 hypothetical protein [Mogibacterium sp.]